MDNATKFLGRIVCKRFAGGMFLGVVDAVDTIDGVVQFHITYADGDTEHVNNYKLKNILVAVAGTLDLVPPTPVEETIDADAPEEADPEVDSEVVPEAPPQAPPFLSVAQAAARRAYCAALLEQGIYPPSAPLRAPEFTPDAIRSFEAIFDDDDMDALMNIEAWEN